jgi:hypothetical protein
MLYTKLDCRITGMIMNHSGWQIHDQCSEALAAAALGRGGPGRAGPTSATVSASPACQRPVPPSE